MSAQSPAPSEPDPDDPIGVRFPNTARIWNYQLGGKDNFAVDREAAELVITSYPPFMPAFARSAPPAGRRFSFDPISVIGNESLMC